MDALKLKIIGKQYVWLLFLCLAICTIGLNIWKASHGIVMHDDAYYLFLLRDGYKGASLFNLLFHNIFLGDIVAVKLTNILLDVISSVFLALGIWRYVDTQISKLTFKDLLILSSLIYISTSLFCVLLTSISYVTLTGNIYMVAIGLILLSLTQEDILKFVGCVGAGMVMGLTPFVMVTNTPLICVLLAFVCWMEATRKGAGIASIGILCGIVLTIMLFFVTCLPFREYVALFTSLSEKTINGGLDETHSLAQILLWTYQSVTSFYLSEVLVGTLAVLGAYWLYKHNSNLKVNVFLVILLVSFCLFFYYTKIWRKGYSVATVLPFYIFAALCMGYNIYRCSALTKYNLLNILLFFVPFFLAIGSDQTIQFRSYCYMGFILPIIYIAIKDRWKLMYPFLFLLLLYWCTTTVKMTKNNWGWLVYSEQTYQIKDLGLSQNLWVDVKTFSNLQSLQPYVKADDKVIISTPLQWGYIYLLDAKPVTYDYRMKDLFAQIKTYDNVKMIEDKWYPYPVNYVDSVRIVLGKDTVFSFPYESGLVYTFE